MVQHLRLLRPMVNSGSSMNLIGEFSVYNALAVIAALYAKGMATEEIIDYLGKIACRKRANGTSADRIAIDDVCRLCAFT